MIGERSFYKKIQITIDSSKAGKSRNLRELEEYMASLSPINFSYFRQDKERGKRVPHCSNKSIHRVVTLCKDIGLLDEKGRLTDAGIKALDQNRFEKVLSRQIITYLKLQGITVESISETIRNSMLQADPVILPTSAAIWQLLGQPIPVERFSVVLTLLGQCKTINSSQRKIFLP